MAKKENSLMIYEKICNLIFYSRKLMIKFPKYERFQVCQEIKQEELTLLKEIVFAWRETDNTCRKKYLIKADNDIFLLKTYVRLVYKAKYISDKNYETWNRQLCEIGRMLGGWIRVCQSR